MIGTYSGFWLGVPQYRVTSHQITLRQVSLPGLICPALVVGRYRSMHESFMLQFLYTISECK